MSGRIHQSAIRESEGRLSIQEFPGGRGRTEMRMVFAVFYPLSHRFSAVVADQRPRSVALPHFRATGHLLNS